MRKTITLFIAIMLVFIGSLPLKASVTLDIKLRFFEGTREGQSNPPQVVTSSYLRPTVSANIQSKYLLDEEMSQIKRVFNLKDVHLTTEAELSWDSNKQTSIGHNFRLNGKQYLVKLFPHDNIRSRRFKITVHEQYNEKKSNLLDTEVTLPEKNIAVFGFEDNAGRPYFISFHISSITGGMVDAVGSGVAGGVEGGVKGGVTGGVTVGVEGGVKGGVVGGVIGGVVGSDEDLKPVRAVGKIRPPKLIKMVDPVYPV